MLVNQRLHFFVPYRRALSLIFHIPTLYQGCKPLSSGFFSWHPSACPQSAQRPGNIGVLNSSQIVGITWAYGGIVGVHHCYPLLSAPVFSRTLYSRYTICPFKGLCPSLAMRSRVSTKGRGSRKVTDRWFGSRGLDTKALPDPFGSLACLTVPPAAISTAVLV